MLVFIVNVSRCCFCVVVSRWCVLLVSRCLFSLGFIFVVIVVVLFGFPVVILIVLVVVAMVLVLVFVFVILVVVLEFSSLSF